MSKVKPEALKDEAEPTTVPDSVTLSAPYAYYGEDGGLHSWSAGQVVTDPDQIADLVERGAPISA